MKRFFVLTSWAIIALCMSTGVMAQKPESKPKEATKAKPSKESDKLEEYDEIIIKKKGDKGGKVTVEIKGDDVLVNGKPLSQYDDDEISVRKREVSVWDGNARVLAAPGSPFRTYSVSNRAFLGVSTEEDDKGAKITSVTDNSAAEKAGLKEGDVITRVDDTKIENHDQLAKAIGKHKPEEKVTIAYLRDGKEQKVSVPLGKQSFGGTYVMPKVATTPDMNFNWDNNMNQSFSFYSRGRIGLRAQDTEDGKGVKVLEVYDESLAEKAGLKEDDIITEFDGKKITSVDELSNAAKESKDKTSISVKYTRDGKPQSAEIKVPKKLKTTNL